MPPMASSLIPSQHVRTIIVLVFTSLFVFLLANLGSAKRAWSLMFIVFRQYLNAEEWKIAPEQKGSRTYL